MDNISYIIRFLDNLRTNLCEFLSSKTTIIMTKYYVKGGLAVLLILIVQLAFSQKTVPKKQNEKLQSVEQNAVADSVIRNNLVVVGNACIGLHCADGESFVFRTILVKENNNRIRFEDTSDTGRFGTRDWEIETNASSKEGGEYFAINDIESDSANTTPFKIEANAPTNSLYVDDGGRIDWNCHAYGWYSSYIRQCPNCTFRARC
jgi:hypothetical protein